MNFSSIVRRTTLFCALSAAILSAQSPYATLSAPAGAASFGHHVAAAGDQDGDGVPDFVVTTAAFTSGTTSPALHLFSGATLAVLNTTPLPAISPFYSTTAFLDAYALVVAGDVDGNGRMEAVVRQRSAGPNTQFCMIVDVLTSATANIIGRVNPIKDATGDGRMDIGVSMLFNITCNSGFGFGSGQTSTFNLVTLPPAAPATVLSTTTSSGCSAGQTLTTSVYRGRAVCGIGDVNNDAKTDLFVWDDVPLTANGLSVYGTIPTLKAYLSTPSGYSLSASFPNINVWQMRGLPDMTGDGRPEAVVVHQAGALGALLPQTLIDFYSSSTGNVYHTLTFGGISGTPYVVEAGDVNRDGVGDFAVELSASATARVRIYSGADFTLLFEIIPPGAQLTPNATANFDSIAYLGDLDHDGWDELAIGRPQTSEVLIYTLRPDGVTDLTPASVPAPIAKIGVDGAFHSAGSLNFHFRDATPNALGVLMVGFSDQYWGSYALPYDLGGIGLPNVNLLTSPDVLDYTYADANGTGGYGYVIPPGPGFAGFTVFGQWFFINPTPVPTQYAVTNGLRVVFH